MVDTMRGDLARPASVIDIGHLQELAAIDTSGAELRFGALARMADVAEDATLLRDYPALAESLQLAASQQIRNAATVGGNLLQRTRCFYFRDGVSACNKREPGAGCAAQDGITRDMALFGGSDSCIATYPATGATPWPRSTRRSRSPPPPVAAPSHSPSCTYPMATIRQPRPPCGPARSSPPSWCRPRLPAAAPLTSRCATARSYAYAVVSATVALEMAGDTVKQARVSLGGVATKPWRSREAEAALTARD